MGWRFKNWVLRVTEPWREEKAARDLEWRIFAQKHNAAGKRPLCMYEGMEKDLNPEDRVEMYEFPPGSPQAEPEDPDCLVKAHQHGTKQQRDMATKTIQDEARLKLEDAKDRLG